MNLKFIESNGFVLFSSNCVSYHYPTCGVVTGLFDLKKLKLNPFLDPITQSNSDTVDWWR
jgi:hypothetical protein